MDPAFQVIAGFVCGSGRQLLDGEGHRCSVRGCIGLAPARQALPVTREHEPSRRRARRGTWRTELQPQCHALREVPAANERTGNTLTWPVAGDWLDLRTYAVVGSIVGRGFLYRLVLGGS